MTPVSTIAARYLVALRVEDLGDWARRPFQGP